MSINVKIKLGQLLRRLRQEAGLSQEQLALAMGSHRNYIGRIERGEHSASITFWLRVCEALGVRLSEVLVEVEN